MNLLGAIGQDMTREERAKQFMPFDAMKGLKEALLDREEKHLRTEMHEVSDEQAEHNSEVLSRIRKNAKVKIACHISSHDIRLSGAVNKIDRQLRQITINGILLSFSDIYEINIIEDEL